MNKAIWIIVIIVLAVVAFMVFRPDSTEDTSSTATTTTTTTGTNNTSNTTGMKSTLGGIFDAPGSYECKYEQVSPTLRATNVIYVADGKLRGEFRSATATTTTLSMVVYDGVNLYVWNEGQPTGKISQPKTIADLPSAIPEDITSGRILGTSSNNVSWDCHAWSKDASKLVRPSYVKFN